MITVRPSNERGHQNHGWLNARHSFSFAGYVDPKHRNFRALRVINQDQVSPGQGFGWHPHEDMEIITLVLEGALEHKDSMNNGEVMRPGDVQRMSAGTGIFHSEFNHSKTEGVHLLQIWIIPASKGIAPSYEQKHFADDEKRNRLRLTVSSDGADGSMAMNRDAKLFVSLLEAEHSVAYDLATNRHGWVQVIRGALDVNGTVLHAGDGAGISNEGSLTFTATEEAEFLFFDLD